MLLMAEQLTKHRADVDSYRACGRIAQDGDERCRVRSSTRRWPVPLSP
jgi:hypothetical protein